MTSPEEKPQWNIHEHIPKLTDKDELEEVIVYKQPDKSLIMPVKFFECPYLLRPSLAWGEITSNDIIRLCYTFPNERNSRNIILPSLRAGMTMIDVGACYGSWTLPALAMGMNVIAFEPTSYSRTILNEHIKLNHFEKRVQVDAEVVDSGTNSIDKLMKKYKPKTVDFIKIDVEGAEFNVLLGAKNTIRKYSPKILVELHTMEHGQTTEDEVKFLTNLCPKLKYNHFFISQKVNKDDKEYYHCYHYI